MTTHSDLIHDFEKTKKDLKAAKEMERANFDFYGEEYRIFSQNRQTIFAALDLAAEIVRKHEDAMAMAIDQALEFISSTYEFSQWNSITTPEWFVTLAAIKGETNAESK